MNKLLTTQKQSPSSEANSYLSDQKIPHLLWKPTTACHWALSWDRSHPSTPPLSDTI